MKLVLIRPPFQDWCNNKLFTEGTSFAGVYQEAFALWQQQAAQQGFQLATWDQAPLDQADIFWFLDLPPSRREFEQICDQLKPETPRVLQILESPVLGIHAFHPKNTQRFQAVLSYEPPEVIHSRPYYFPYRLPNAHRKPQTNLPYSDRKGMLLINSNRVEGWFGMRQVGLAGLPAIGKFFSGWHCTPAMFQEVVSGELYSHRRQIARLAAKIAPGFLDIYGRGWNGEQVSWCPLYPNRPYACWRGIPQVSKWDLCEQYRFVLSFENFRGNRGYISEKIFDPLFAGSVPVYLGDDQIEKYVPPEVFVDARDFKHYTDLLQYLINVPEEQWQAMHRSGQQFLESEQFKAFESKGYAPVATQVLKQLES